VECQNIHVCRYTHAHIASSACVPLLHDSCQGNAFPHVSVLSEGMPFPSENSGKMEFPLDNITDVYIILSVQVNYDIARCHVGLILQKIFLVCSNNNVIPYRCMYTHINCDILRVSDLPTPHISSRIVRFPQES
jgi:hypothetical protein